MSLTSGRTRRGRSNSTDGAGAAGVSVRRQGRRRSEPRRYAVTILPRLFSLPSKITAKVHVPSSSRREYPEPSSVIEADLCRIVLLKGPSSSRPRRSGDCSVAGRLIGTLSGRPTSLNTQKHNQEDRIAGDAQYERHDPSVPQPGSNCENDHTCNAGSETEPSQL